MRRGVKVDQETIIAEKGLLLRNLITIKTDNKR